MNIYPSKNTLLMGVNDGRFIPVTADANGRLQTGGGAVDGGHFVIYPTEVALAMGIYDGRFVALAVDENGNLLTDGGSSGTTDHAALDNLDYANAGHTGFAGTGVENTFTANQLFRASATVPVVASNLLTNGEFTSDLSGWTAGAGWSWSAGAALHTVGNTAKLTQNISSLAVGDLYMLSVQISGMTAGWVDIYIDPSFTAEVYVDTGDGTYRDVFIMDATSATIAVEPSSDFDGRVEFVRFQAVIGGIPAPLAILDINGDVAIELRPDLAARQNVFVGKDAGGVNETGQVNVAIGTNALAENFAGGSNVAIGFNALRNSQQSNNVGIGRSALENNTAGHDNLAIGYNTMQDSTGSYNVAVGANAAENVTGQRGIFIGNNVAPNETADDKLHIGNNSTLSLISGTMDASATNQKIQFHAKIVILADLPTSSAGLPAGALWNNSGVLNIA